MLSEDKEKELIELFVALDDFCLAFYQSPHLQQQSLPQVAFRGKSSTGWFFGFKRHLVINQYGEVVNFLFTPANVANNNQLVLQHQLQGLMGKCYGDRGYLSNLFEQFYQEGLQLIIKIRSTIKTNLYNCKINLSCVKEF